MPKRFEHIEENLYMIDAAAARTRSEATAERFYQLGLRSEDSGEKDPARCYRAAITYDPNHSDAWASLGVIEHTRGNVDVAITCYQNALRIDPQDLGPHHNLAICYASQESFKKAIKHYHLALKIYPCHDKSHFNLAELYERMYLPRKAAEHYRLFLKYAVPKDDPKGSDRKYARETLRYLAASEPLKIVFRNTASPRKRRRASEERPPKPPFIVP